MIEVNSDSKEFVKIYSSALKFIESEQFISDINYYYDVLSRDRKLNYMFKSAYLYYDYIDNRITDNLIIGRSAFQFTIQGDPKQNLIDSFDKYQKHFIKYGITSSDWSVFEGESPLIQVDDNYLNTLVKFMVFDDNPFVLYPSIKLEGKYNELVSNKVKNNYGYLLETDSGFERLTYYALTLNSKEVINELYSLNIDHFIKNNPSKMILFVPFIIELNDDDLIKAIDHLFNCTEDPLLKTYIASIIEVLVKSLDEANKRNIIIERTIVDPNNNERLIEMLHHHKVIYSCKVNFKFNSIENFENCYESLKDIFVYNDSYYTDEDSFTDLIKDINVIINLDGKYLINDPNSLTFKK